MTDEEKAKRDKLDQKVINWIFAIVIIIGILFYFFAPDWTHDGYYGKGKSYSPTYTEIPAGGTCAGHVEVVKPLSGGTKLVCVYP